MHNHKAVTFTCLLHASFLSLVTCLSPEYIEELINIHNFYRRVVASSLPPYTVSNMNKLVWSNTLALEAAQSVTCLSWRRRNPTTAQDSSRSMNVGRRQRGPGVITQIIRRWYQERSTFLPADVACLPWNSCNHFRHMINAKHRVMGCAAAMSCGRNRNKLVLMCLYEGGSPDEFGFHYGPACTGCEAPSSFCKFNICVSCNAQAEECDCKKTCQKEGMGYGILRPSDCTCQCTYGHGPNCDRPCQNTQQFVDFDVCSLLSESDCRDEAMGQHYREFCPAVCSCRPMPSESINANSTS